MANTTVRPRFIDAGPIDKWILAPVVGLVALGTVMIYSSSFVGAYMNGLSPNYFLIRHLIWLCIGSLALFVTSKINYQYWRRYSVPLMIVALLALAFVVFAPKSIAPEINGAHRWIRLGPLSAQPSEFAKIVFIIYAADWLSQKGEKVRNLWYGLIPFGIILGFIIGLIMLEPDMGTSIVFAMIGGVMLFCAGAKIMQLLAGAALAFAAFLVLIIEESYRLNRLTIFLDPWKDPNGLGFHPIQSLFTLGSGGLIGEGLGASRQKFGWLPEAHTDSIMAVIGDELGFVGAVFVLILIIVVAVHGFRTALRSPDAFGSLMATGITTWIVFQSFLNVGVVTLTVPFTGVPMPFISFGGSSLVVLMSAVGILLNLSKYAQPVAEDRKELRRRKLLLRRGIS